jgi:hypothetical protein
MQPVMDNHKAQQMGPTRSRGRLGGCERQVLKVLAESSRPVTMLQLRVGTGASPNKIHTALETLTEGGFISHLNTVIDSWVCRSPFCVLPGGSDGRPRPL